MVYSVSHKEDDVKDIFKQSRSIEDNKVAQCALYFYGDFGGVSKYSFYNLEAFFGGIYRLKPDNFEDN